MKHLFEMLYPLPVNARTVVGILSWAVFSCGGHLSQEGNHYRVQRATSYRFAAPQHFTRLEAEGADAAFRDAANRCTLLINSRCGRAYDIPLVSLTSHLLIGFTERTDVSHEEGWTMGRESLSTSWIARLDGLPVELITRVWKRDACAFDVVLMHHPRVTGSEHPALPTAIDIPQSCLDAHGQLAASVGP